jgi:hypothetical protein
MPENTARAPQVVVNWNSSLIVVYSVFTGSGAIWKDSLEVLI